LAGFQSLWGFTYRRWEKAAMKRRKGAMEEIAEAG